MLSKHETRINGPVLSMKKINLLIVTAAPSATIYPSFTCGDRDMNFDFNGEPEDYVKEAASVDGVTQYVGNRPKIRQMVEERNKELMEVSSKGGNVHTWTLDFSDCFYLFLSSLNQDKQAAIITMYAEELTASASAMDDETNKIIAETEKVERTGAAIGQWVGAGVLLVFLLLIFGIFK
ncbi:hypothetical protein CR62_24370 [Serratia grimesii]|uniref:Uncharacterized protein n=1 Tax=Serratia grimesii TaxID=82995 RepID=A0ABR4UAF5_9GAMM|nr:hypothetical protein CR62_24370 [Serratia grimesii]